MNCKQCGRCCIIYNGAVRLTKEEIKSGKYESQEHPEVKGLFLNTKFVRIKELATYLFVCVYFNVETNKCAIHDRKPLACQSFSCGGEQDALRNWRVFKHELESLK